MKIIPRLDKDKVNKTKNIRRGEDIMFNKIRALMYKVADVFTAVYLSSIN